MKKLDLPFLQQRREKDCMTTCLKMIMDYYGNVEDYDQLIRQFAFYEMGLSMPQIGKFALEKGFSVEIDLMNPHIFNLKDVGKSQDDVYKKIQTVPLPNKQLDMIRNYMLDFMEKGGIVNPRIPTKQHIIDELNQDRPVLTILASRLLHSHCDEFNFHGNVIYGYEGDDFFLFDSQIAEKGGGEHRINQDIVMYSIYCTTHADTDNGSILKIRKNG